MAKVLTDREMLDIIRRAVEEGEIDDVGNYTNFLEDLGKLITDYFGGRPSVISRDLGDGLGWTMCFNVDDSLPLDGGVFKKYDTDVTWEDGEEYQE